jgi:hypothetical protein
MGQPPLKRKKMLTKAARAFKQAGTMADRAGLRKKAPISPACASALHSLLNSARDQSQTAKLGQ